MPSHPIATWITPCNSRNVQVLGTSTRRHTIGLIPSSQTLTCTISAASASAADEAVSMTGLVRFGARVTRPAYRRSPFPVAGTPDILMLSLGTAHAAARVRVCDGPRGNTGECLSRVAAGVNRRLAMRGGAAQPEYVRVE